MENDPNIKIIMIGLGLVAMGLLVALSSRLLPQNIGGTGTVNNQSAGTSSLTNVVSSTISIPSFNGESASSSGTSTN